jgi:iron(II)-dependent oxidoreductase
MRTTATIKKVHSIKSFRVLLACIALFVLGSVDGMGANDVPHVPSSAARSTAQPAAAQPLNAEQECPVLPGCPSGPSVPLPPTVSRLADPKVHAPAVDENSVSEGTGKYKGMVLVPAGTFDMGSRSGEGRHDEHPIHRVYLKEFYIAKHEVTVREFCDFLNAQGENSRDGLPRVKLENPDCPVAKKSGNYFQPKPGLADKPMTCVSWNGAADYAQWAGGRLPTAAEWEKAALVTTPYPPSDYLTTLPRDGSVEVQIADPGIRGLAGMVGNVWEWCSDWYAADYYEQSPSSNPPGPSLGQEKEIRGGSWASPEASKRPRNRHSAFPRGYFRTVGFRIVKDL